MLEDYASRMEDMIEEKTLLQTELEEKDSLQCCIQRLRDETRELRQELALREMRQCSTGTSNHYNSANASAAGSSRPAAAVAPFNQPPGGVGSRRTTSDDQQQPMDVDLNRGRCL